MTTTDAHPDRGSNVIDDFMAACPQPTDGQTEQWCAAHPGEADEIRTYARIMRENPWRELDADEEERCGAIADRLTGRLMDHVAAKRRATLPELIASRGTTVAKVADAIGIDRGILADVVAGRLMPPVGPRFVSALSTALGMAREGIRAAVAASFDAPRIGFASAEGDTASGARTWAQSVAAAPISDERKAYWLGED